MIQPFLKAVPILEQLERAGFEAYFVGGSVRDYLTHRDIHDVDIATSATPEEVKRIFPKHVDLGIAHGTILVIYESIPYEITTFRTETAYKDYRRPDGVIFIRSLIEDLKRRDFTMNAIAMSSSGEIIDPFHGKQAIIDKQIKTVGKPEDRFNEDALRMMRAIRFVSQLEFTIETKTKTALKQYGHLLTKISMERIAAEFEKMLSGKGIQIALRLLVDTELHHYLPGFEDKAEHMLSLTTYEWTELSIDELWALLLFSCEVDIDEVEPLLRKWKLPIKQIKQTKHLLKILSARLQQDWTVHLLYKAKRENVEKVERLFCIVTNTCDTSIKDVVSKYNALPITNRDELQVNGNELMEWLLRRGGPWLSDLLDDIERNILEGKLANERQAIREWVETCNRN